MRTLLFSAALCAASLFAFDAITDAAKKKVADGKYEEAIADLNAAMQKNPKSVEIKKALAGAYFAQGKAMMTDAQLPPMRKYPASLRAFRKTVELDPTNTEAKSNIKTIEDIYKSMGRPVPQ